MSERGLRHKRRESRSSQSRSRNRIQFRWSVLAKLLNWARSEFIPSAGPFPRYTKLLERIERNLRCQGVPGALLWIKAVRSCYLQYLSVPDNSSEERKFKLRLIRYLGHRGAATVLKKSPPVIRMVLTALTVLRSFHLPAVVDVSSITDPTSQSDFGTWKSHVSGFWALLVKLRYTKPALTHQWSKFHFSVKAGPSGGPAILGATREIGHLPSSLWESLRVLGGDVLHQKMKDVLEVHTQMANVSTNLLKFSTSGVLLDGSPAGDFQKERTIRRLVGIEDKEGKSRVIAIGDYWSQTALYPLHASLFKILRKIPQDMTFDQGAFLEQVRSWGKVTLYSVDLTSATDRFPIDFIADVLGGGLSGLVVSAWKDIMVGYPFQVTNHPDVKYSVGNPMGFYSSWASFALAHHFLVYWCCQDLGIKWTRAKYVILGDDVLIGDSRLGEAYQARILSLGVTFSKAKTYVSADLCEFAKRYIFRGEEVSPFPISSVVSNLGDVSLLVPAIIGETRKGLVPKSGVPGSIETLSRFLGHRSAMARRRRIRGEDSVLATEFFQGKVDPVEFVVRSSGSLDEGHLDYLQSVGLDILRTALRRVIAQGLDRGNRPIEQLLWEDAFTVTRAMESTGGTAEQVLSIPLFEVYAAFEESLFAVDRRGWEALRSRDPDEDPYSLLSLLAEIASDPLRDSVWGLSKERRRVRGLSRLARACREASYEYATEEGRPDNRLFSSDFPVRYAIGNLIGYIRNSGPVTEIYFSYPWFGYTPFARAKLGLKGKVLPWTGTAPSPNIGSAP